MVIIEVYQNVEELLITAQFPAMVRVGEQISILQEDYYQYYVVKKIWYRIENGGSNCFACAEVVIDD